MWSRRPIVGLLGAALLASGLGCSSGEQESVVPTVPVPLEPSCEVPSVTLPDGRCLRPGVPEDGCAAGFRHDGEYGCEPVLPAEPCPPGRIAVPGDEECRPVRPCGEDRWGELPGDGASLYVDGAYAGGDSDGSEERPFTTIGDAVATAAAGALVAVAAGTYVEDLVVTGRPLRLWGRCPDMVELVGTGGETAALGIGPGASGSEVRGLAISGEALGVLLWGSQDVTLEQLWVHDTASRGIDIETDGPTSARLADSLVERTHDFGLFVMGAALSLEHSAVRATLPGESSSKFGRGINLVPCPTGACDTTVHASATVLGSLVEQSHEFGLFAAAAEVTVEGSVVRATLPQASTGLGGCGVHIQPCGPNHGCDEMTRGRVTLRGSLVADNHYYGVYVQGSDASVEDSVVRGTLPHPSDDELGIGLSLESCSPDVGCSPTVAASGTVRRSLVEQNHDIGLLVNGGELTLDRSVVRGTQPRAADLIRGRGVHIQQLCSGPGDCDHEARSSALVRESLVEHNYEIGLFMEGADVTVQDTVVRATLPQASDLAFGRGINIQACGLSNGCQVTARANVTLQGTLVEQSYDIGLLVSGSDVTVEDSIVRSTVARAADGLFGDGIVAVTEHAPANATLRAVLVDDSARAGIASFGAHLSLRDTAIRCAAFALAGEPFAEVDFTFADEGGNGCGCPIADGTCQTVSIGLAPPQPLGPSQ